MKRLSAVVRLPFCLAAMFAIAFLSQADPGNKRIPSTQEEHASHAIHIVDQNGRPAVSGMPLGGGQIFDVAVGQDGFSFTPPNLIIAAGDSVRWTWFSNGHSVTSGDSCIVNGEFCSPDDTNCDTGTLSNDGFVYEHTFTQAGTYSYFCFSHCAFGMTGVVTVLPSPPSGFLYGSTGGDHANGGGRLWLIDLPNQNATLIGDTGFDRLGAIAFDSKGTLYGVSGASATRGTLMTIDPTNGTPTVIGLLSDPDAAVDGLRFNSQGVLYGGSFNNTKSVGELLTIDPSNGNVLSSLTLVGSGNSFCPGIAFDSKDVLYGSRGNSSGREEDIDLVDQITGVLTPIGLMEEVISDIVFTPDGNFYGSSPNGGAIFSIDPVTGVKTFLFNTGILQLSGLAAAPATPTPTPTVTPTPGGRSTPTPRPRPTPHPRPTP